MLYSKPRNVAAWVSHTFDEASSDWIGSIHKYYRDRTSEPLQRRYQLTAYGNDDVRRERDQFRRAAQILFDLPRLVPPVSEAILPSVSVFGDD